MGDTDDLNGELFRAVQRGDLESASAALASGADARHVEASRGEANNTLTPVLFLACEKKHLELVRLLLAHGADPNACGVDEWPYRSPEGRTDRYTNTCLRAAMPSLEIVSLLLEKGANPNVRSESYQDFSALIHALEDAGESEELKAVLRLHGASRNKWLPTAAEVARKQLASSKRQHKRKRR
jgi:ankyrin repeat protein